MDIRSWLRAHFQVTRESGNELIFNCPKCNHPRFYFNVQKKVGWCHRASCHYAPDLSELKTRTNSDLLIIDEYEDPPVKPNESRPIQLPGEPIFPLDAMQPDYTIFRAPIGYLNRRGISLPNIKKFGMTYDGIRVYVPIYSDQKLVSYIGRDIHGLTNKKYRYASGTNVSHYIFGWDESKLWDTLVLVENTFVSIWLRDAINCSTNFGSHLSQEQIKKIAYDSRIKKVAILWDEGAEQRAEKAVYQLQELAVPAAYARLKGQPDNYLMSDIVDIAKRTLEAADKGELCIVGR